MTPRNVLTQVSGALVALCLAASPSEAEPATMMFGQAELISPGSSDTYFASVSGPPSYWTPPAARAPEIRDVARALNGDVDEIYAFVRNHIEFEPVFGLRKGALGTLLDRSGSAFDQAQLMVELLRESGIPARYVYGSIDLTGAEFDAWFGLSNASPACQFLANGGIPGRINGSTNCSSLSGTVATVELRHLWVEAEIDATWYAFDPARKVYEEFAPVDLTTAMNFSGASNLITTAISGSSASTIAGAPARSGYDSAAVASTLDGLASTLITYLNANHSSSPLEVVAGGRRLLSRDTRAPALRQASLPYASGSPQTWTTQIPNQYRTHLTVQLQHWSGMSPMTSTTFFVDDIYGRRLTIDRFATETIPQADEVYLRLDDALIETTTLHAPSGDVFYPDVDGLTLILAVDHPYAADGGSYMDQTRERVHAQLSHPLAIIHGWGDVSSALEARFSRERIHDNVVLRLGACGVIGPGSIGIVRQRENRAKAPIGYGWLAQFTRASALQARLGGGRRQHHHSFGLSGTITRWTNMCAPVAGDPAWIVRDSGELLDIVSGLSLIDATGDEARRDAVAHAIAVIGSMLEGSLTEQQGDTTAPASTVERFEWVANEPGVDRRFVLVTPQNEAAVHAASGIRASRTSEYLSAGYYVIEAEGSQFGPGRELVSCSGVVDCAHDTTIAFERGGAFIAFQSDASAIAHLVHAGTSVAIKGGGATIENDFEPSSAAEMLEQQFEDRNVAHGVDATSGELTYMERPDISVGAGPAPYSLAFQRRFANGGSRTRGLGAGWLHNWDYSARLSGSGMEALGAGQTLNATASLVAMTILPELLLSIDAPDQDSLDRYMTAMFVAHWQREHFTNNVATLRLGFNQLQFVRLPTGAFNPPPGTVAGLEQFGARRLDLTPDDDPIPYGDARRVRYKWYYDDVWFQLTTADGDEIDFRHYRNLDGTANESSYYANGHVEPFLGVEQRLARGVDVAFTYDAEYRLESVSNSLGRELEFLWTDTPVNFNDSNLTTVRASDAAGTGWRQAVLAYAESNAPTGIQFLSSQDLAPENSNRTLLTSVTDATGATTTYVYERPNGSVTASEPDARVDYAPRLTHVFGPVDPNTALLTVRYDRLWRVAQIGGPVDGPWIHRTVANAVSETQDPLGHISRTEFNLVIAELAPPGADARHWRMSQSTDPEGHFSIAWNDALGRSTESRAYDAGGVDYTDRTALTYDLLHNVTRERRYEDGDDLATDTAFRDTVHAFADANWPTKSTSATDANAHTWSWTYDAATGQLRHQYGPSGEHTEVLYNSAGQITEIRETTQ